MSSYRSHYRSRRSDAFSPPPPPPPELPPLPPPPPPAPSHRSAGDFWRPESSQQFSFRPPNTGPSYPRDQSRVRERPNHSLRDGPRLNTRLNDRRNLNSGKRSYPQSDKSRHRNVSSRPLLQHKHSDSDSTMEVVGVTEGTTKYLDVDISGDSDEKEDGQAGSDAEYGEIADNGLDGALERDPTEPPAKRRHIDPSSMQEKQWSNPDPYFVLPPTNEPAGKRKDPVKQLRKYLKTDWDKPAAASNQVTANDDFISFDIDATSSNLPGHFELKNQSDDFTGSAAAGAATDAIYLGAEWKESDGAKLSQNNQSPTVSMTDKIIDQSSSETGLARVSSLVPPGIIVLDLLDGPNMLESMDANRKRTRDSQSKGGFQNSLDRSVGLLADWRPGGDINPIPWLNRPEYITVSAGLRLHMEICDFFDFVRPQKFEETVREHLIDRLQDLVRTSSPDYSVHCFGSFAAGLYLPNADMDVVVMSNSYIHRREPILCQSSTKLYKFSRFISESGIAKAGSVDVIAHAKVPLVKFVDNRTNIRVDMSFENDSGVHAISTFKQWKTHHPAMPILLTLVKQFLMMRGLNEVQHGGLGGFSVTCLITSLLQNMPRVQSGLLKPEENLGEMLLEFLDFYGNRFDVSRTGIEMEPHGYFDKHAFNRPRYHNPKSKPSLPDRLAIMDPNNAGNDISGGSRLVLLIFKQFAQAHDEILAAMKERHRPSLLDWMIGGDYTDVMSQRDHMQVLYNIDGSGQSQRGGSLTHAVRAADDVTNRHGGRYSSSNVRSISTIGIGTSGGPQGQASITSSSKGSAKILQRHAKDLPGNSSSIHRSKRRRFMQSDENDMTEQLMSQHSQEAAQHPLAYMNHQGDSETAAGATTTNPITLD